MKHDLFSRLVAAVLLGIAFGWYIHYDYVRWNLRGQDAFVAFQMRRFDMYMATPPPAIASIVVMALLVTGFCAVYEVITSLVSAVMKRTPSKGRAE